MVSVTVTEPRFRPQDVSILLASRRMDTEPRGRHGLPLAVATDPANQGRFVVPQPTLDFAQKTLDKAQDAYKKKWGDQADMDALLWRVILEE